MSEYIPYFCFCVWDTSLSICSSCLILSLHFSTWFGFYCREVFQCLSDCIFFFHSSTDGHQVYLRFLLLHIVVLLTILNTFPCCMNIQHLDICIIIEFLDLEVDLFTFLLCENSILMSTWQYKIPFLPAMMWYFTFSTSSPVYAVTGDFYFPIMTGNDDNSEIYWSALPWCIRMLSNF